MHPQEGVDLNDLNEDGDGVLVITAMNVSIKYAEFYNYLKKRFSRRTLSPRVINTSGGILQSSNDRSGSTFGREFGHQVSDY